jgi:formylglycine-generating enzyme required for sulfatase activity
MTVARQFTGVWRKRENSPLSWPRALAASPRGRRPRGDAARAREGQADDLDRLIPTSELAGYIHRVPPGLNGALTRPCYPTRSPVNRARTITQRLLAGFIRLGLNSTAIYGRVSAGWMNSYFQRKSVTMTHDTSAFLRALGVLLCGLLVAGVAWSGPVTGVTLQLAPASPQVVGTPLTLTAVATGAAQAQYRFRVGFLSGGSWSWATVQEYSAQATCRWTPLGARTYSVAVYAREVGSTATYQAYKAVSLVITAPLAGVALGVAPAGTIPAGTPLSLTALPVGGARVEYQFRVGVPQAGGWAWTLLQAYRTGGTCAWTAPTPGRYALAVEARTIDSELPVEFSHVVGVIVTDTVPPLSSVALATDLLSPQPVGGPILLSATAVGGLGVQYEFRLGQRGETGWSWRVLRPYAPAATALWTPEAPGTYALMVYAREAGVTALYQVYRTLAFTIGQVAITPAACTLPVGGAGEFTAALVGLPAGVRWRVQEAAGGTISAAGLYRAPAVPGLYHVEATSSNVPAFAAVVPVTVVVPDRVQPVDGAALVWLPAATVALGSPVGEGEEDEHPIRTAAVEGVWWYKYEVTVDQYRAFCQATGRALPPEPAWGMNGARPVVNVTWADAAAYAAWAGGRLPTEAEWERAARGGEGRRFAWGNVWSDERCAIWANSGGNGTEVGPHPVGSFPTGATPEGIGDLTGNVWEWCADRYLAPGVRYSARGGGWSYGGEFFLRAANRTGLPAEGRFDFVGFRCVVDR